MNSRKKLNKIGCIVILSFLLVFTSCRNKQEQHHHENNHTQHSGIVYICPMDPEIVSDKPGNCPICKMKLEPMENESLPQIISPNQQVLSKQATVKPQEGNNGNMLKAEGYIVLAQNRNQAVAARFGGRIEKLYVKFNNQYVKQGEKIMDLYSPSLRTFQEEHLFLLKSKAENSLIEKSREKLRLLGFTENQIKELEKNGTVALTVSVFSPANGYVFFNTQLPKDNTTAKNTSAMNVMSMSHNTVSQNSFATDASQIREGMYVNEGQTLFSVNDLQEVWALVSIPNQYISQIHENQSVEIITENNTSKSLKGKVALIEQTFEEVNQRFARVRIVLLNSNNSLKINSLVTAQFQLSDSKNLVVPASAVYKTGLSAYVWVKIGTTKNGTGIFQARKVIAGTSNKGMISIISGLSSDEEIAKQAGLMIDSETFINEN
ncbi:MAG: hypothetical protein KatS3mg027_0234 [Bacteroidia bacterium]|nr:MAG: hypothetical protein KatS3mg027_0234 [Bacteroidia bacterium]